MSQRYSTQQDDDQNIQTTGIKRELLHLKLLLKKNFIVSSRSIISTIIEIGSPIAFILILFLIARSTGNDNPTTYYENNLPKCEAYSQNRCFNLMFSPSNSPSVIAIMNILSEMNDGIKILTYPGTTGPLPELKQTIGLKGGMIGMPSVDDTFMFVLDYPNVTIGGVDFTSFPNNFPGFTNETDPLVSSVLGNNNLLFNVLVNTTCPNIMASCIDYTVPLTNAIQQAIITYYSRQSTNSGTDPTVSFSTNSFAFYPVQRPALASFGGLFYYCGSMITFIYLLYKIAFEKEHKLKQGMIMMGLSEPMYWVSWFFTSFTIDLLVTLITIAVGAAFQLPFFLGTNFLVLFLTFFLFTVSMSAVAYFLLSLISTTKTAIGIGMAIFIVGSIFQMVFSSMGPLIFALVYETGSTAATIARVIMFFLPMFHFNKVLTYINSATQNYPTTHFTLSDLSTNLNQKGGDTIIPTSGESLGYLVALTGIYLVLAWYFDNVIPGNDGTSQVPWFFLTPSYWGLSMKQPHHIPVPHISDSDVSEAINRAHDPSNRAPFIIRGISKTYRNFLRPSKSVHAVKYLSLSVEHGTVLGFLGSNGAGKSTTIGVLTGLISPSSGDAIIYGNSVVSNIAAVRRVTSVVPQHDILWNEMTAYEHLQLFAELKGIPQHKREAAIAVALDQVRLTKISKNLISTYSGGMKRRLSVAIGCMGSPKIIFMDEPTTGLDVVSCRKIWNLIKEVKKDKVVILTSHSLIEIEYLSDNIVIMANGVMACAGNSLQLKERFGEGFSLNIVSKTEEAIPQIVEMITTTIPGSKFLKQSSTLLNFGFPATTDPNILVSFLKLLESIIKDENNVMIKDVSMSHSTLDDVFLKVDHLSKLKTQ